MSQRIPPRFATWLLGRFTGNEALIGDLLEEYHRGRSRLWYWRQTSIAVLRTTVADVRSHPVLALRAFLLMVVCVLCFQYCLIPVFDVFTRDLIWKLNPRLLYPEHFTLFTFSYFLVLHALEPCIGYLIGARIVARLHRSHQVAFTLFNAALVLFVNNALELLWFISHKPHHLQWFSSYVFYFVPVSLLFVVSTLIGGLRKSSRQQPVQV